MSQLFQSQNRQVSRAPGVSLDSTITLAAISIPVAFFAARARFFEQAEMIVSALERERTEVCKPG